jgi:hydroxyacylglutathione hydrolase
MRLAKALKVTVLTIVLLALGVAVLVVGVLMFGGARLKNRSTLADGHVTVIVDRMGPVRICAYIVDLADGGFALVDTGMDPDAKAIRAALKDRGAGTGEVRAVFVTHAHDDHAGAVRAFPNAEVFALGADAGALRRGGIVTHALADGERLTVSGTTVEAFAVPGHTSGSAAYLIRGVLFLGDSAASVSDTAIAPNDFAYTADSDINDRSLIALAARLKPRSDEISYIAFGHHGAVRGLGPLLEWASSVEHRASR